MALALFDKFVVVSKDAPKPVPLEEDKKAPPVNPEGVLRQMLSLYKKGFIVATPSASKVGKRRKGRKAVVVGPSTSLQCVPTVRQWFRFTTDQAGTALVSTLFGICGGICTTANTTVRNWAGSVRLHRVRIFSTASNSGATLVALIWAASGTNATRTPDFVYDQSMPTNQVMGQSVEYVVPKESLVWLWFETTYTPIADPVFSWSTGTARCIIDVDMEFTLGCTNALLTTTISGTHAVGTVGYGNLDGVGGHCTPLDLPTWN